MNPVLLKPQTEIGAQVVVQGRVWGNAKAREYQALKGDLLLKVLESFERLSGDADLVVVEGAGSTAEVNLREGDIANMGFAIAAGVPVVLVGDIDRGGVIASVVVTRTNPHQPVRCSTSSIGFAPSSPPAARQISQAAGIRAETQMPAFTATRRRRAEPAIRKMPSERTAQVHTGVELRDLLRISVEHQGRALPELAEATLPGLTPARVIHFGVHVRVETVLTRSRHGPGRGRHLFREAKADDRFDALEAIFPGHNEP